MAYRFKACVTYYQRGRRARRVCKGFSERRIAKIMGLPKGSKVNNFQVNVPQR